MFASDYELTAAEAHAMRSAVMELANRYRASYAAAANEMDVLDQLFGADACRRVGILRLPKRFLLSVVMPVYNEARTIIDVIDRVRSVDLPMEIVVVDDGSTDATADVLAERSARGEFKLVGHEKNQGKGAALKTGFQHVRGDVVVIQDADMEYDPQDFRLLLQPILEDQADVVYGSRFCTADGSQSPLWHRKGNQLITRLSNLATGQKFSDVETCYKMLRRKLLDGIAPNLREKGFGIELEMTAKLAKLKDVRFYERPISYTKRSYAEGKKIGWRDAIWALWCILRY